MSFQMWRSLKTQVTSLISVRNCIWSERPQVNSYKEASQGSNIKDSKPGKLWPPLLEPDVGGFWYRHSLVGLRASSFEQKNCQQLNSGIRLLFFGISNNESWPMTISPLLFLSSSFIAFIISPFHGLQALGMQSGTPVFYENLSLSMV
jgi:hypothetical protein